MRTHVELLGLINVVSGAFWGLLGLFFLAMFLLLAPTTGDPPGSFVLAVMGIGIGGFLILLGALTLVAGIGLLKHESWARILALVVGILAFFNFPLGTVVALYTFWVLTNTEVATLFGASA